MHAQLMSGLAARLEALEPLQKAHTALEAQYEIALDERESWVARRDQFDSQGEELRRMEEKVPVPL